MESVDDSSSTGCGSAPASSSGKTKQQQQTATPLSRASLYTSLEDLKNDDAVGSQQSFITRTTNNEAALVDFYQTLSNDYHRSVLPSQPRNNASRPIGEFEIHERVRLRALTLISGGINASISTTQKRGGGESSADSSGKRRKLPEVKRDHQCAERIVKRQYEFAKQLNERWNDYVWKLTSPWLESSSATLQLPSHDHLCKRMQHLTSVGDFEWVGAKVQIKECRQHQRYVGRVGTILAETANTWRVLEEATDDGNNLQPLVIPKRESLLLATMPASNGCASILLGEQAMAAKPPRIKVSRKPWRNGAVFTNGG